MRIVTLIGQKFNNLTVLSPGRRVRYSQYWVCLCDCGAICSVRVDRLRSGHTKSCGCLQKAVASRLGTRKWKHGQCRPRTSIYRIYSSAQQRCQNPKDQSWPDYGGRGIEFRFKSFADFFSAVGPRPSSFHMLDRKNNDGHYEAGNVRWVSRSVSALNRRKARSRPRKIDDAGIARVLSLRRQDLTLEKIGKAVGCTGTRVYQIIKALRAQ